MAPRPARRAGRAASGHGARGPAVARLDPVLARLRGAPAGSAPRSRRARRRPRPSSAGRGRGRRLGLVSSRDWAEAVAARFGLERVGDGRPAEGADPRRPALVRASCATPAVLPVEVRDGRLRLAMADPGNAYARRAVALATGLEVVPVVAALEDLQKAYARYWDAGQTALQRIVDDLGTEFDASRRRGHRAPDRRRPGGAGRPAGQPAADRRAAAARLGHPCRARPRPSAGALPRPRPPARGRRAAGAPRRRGDLAHQDPRQARHRRAAAAAGRARPADAARPPDRPARRHRAVDPRREHGHPHPRHERGRASISPSLGPRRRTSSGG